MFVFGLRAVEIDGVGAVYGDLEYGFLIRGQCEGGAEGIGRGPTASPAATGMKPEYMPPAKGWHGAERLP